MIPSLAESLPNELELYIEDLSGEDAADFWQKYEKLEGNLSKNIERLKFNSIVQQMVANSLSDHLKTCSYPDGPDYFKCQHNRGYTYALNKLKKIEIELNDITVPDSDIITVAEFSEFRDKVNNIVEEVNILRLGQEIIFDQASANFEELKSLFFLGKKTWRQVAKGKIIDAVGGGLIAEATSKPIMSLISNL